METTSLIRALRDPRAYPFPAGEVEVLQTHASVLFFAGERVYKVKKPVDLGFLDFSTVERRLHFCQEEVRLNAALAPGVYLRVATIARGEDGVLRIDGPGTAVEHAVEMVRLPRERMLDRALESGGPEARVLDELIERLATFHGAASTGPGVDESGTPEAIARKVLTNLEQAGAHAGKIPDEPGDDAPVLSPKQLGHLQSWSRAFLEKHRGLLEARVRERRIREGHGDLHAGNICLSERGLLIYDRIEFRRDFRCLDVAAEVAFLAMDLDARGRRDLAGAVVEGYAARTHDPGLARVQALYRSHFAAVRGKVAAIRANEAEVDEPARRQAWAEAARYFQLAGAYTLRPSLVVMCGLPGSGKSWLAGRLAGALGLEVVSSDRVRKELAGLSPTDRTAGAVRERLYAPQMTERTYAEVLSRCRAALAAGRGAIADATFATRGLRAPFLAVQAPRVLVHAQADEATVRARLAARAADPGEPSDAGVEVYERARSRFEPPAEAHPRVDALPRMRPEVVASRVLDALL